MEMTIKAKAFAGQSRRIHRVTVIDGVVRVWDAVAGHYTTCHSLSTSAIRRILALAN